MTNWAPFPAGAFMHCEALTELWIPASVTAIGNGAFWGCSSLRDIKLPAALTTIGTSAFTGCSSLTEVRLPGRVTAIGARAFWGCSNLVVLQLSTDLATIGDQAFNHCTACSPPIVSGYSSGGIGKKPFLFLVRENILCCYHPVCRATAPVASVKKTSHFS